MSSSQQQQQQLHQHSSGLTLTPSSGSGAGVALRKKQAKIQQTLQLNKRLGHMSTQPQTNHSTSKHKKFSVIRTIERQMQQYAAEGQITLDPPDAEDNHLVINQNSAQNLILQHYTPPQGMMFTYEPPSTSSQDILGYKTNNINLTNQRLHGNVENHGGYLARTEHANQQVRISMEKSAATSVGNQRQPSKQRHPSRGHSNQQQQQHQPNVGLIYNLAGYMGGEGGNQIPPALSTINQAPFILQQYSSIPVKASTATNAALKKNAQIYVTASGGNTSMIGDSAPATVSHHNQVQLKLLNKQASALMKMYGNSGNIYRKQFKSVERKQLQPASNTTTGYSNYKMYHQNQQFKQYTSQSNTKLSGQTLQPALEIHQSQRKSIGGIATLNNSVISAINLYDSSAQNLASLESSRQNNTYQKSGLRNLNQSQTYNKFKVKSNIGVESNSFRKARVSSKNVLTRLNPGNMIRSIQPLEELRNNYNYDTRVQTQSNNQQRFAHPPGQYDLNKKNSINNHTNLLIQQNEMYGAADSSNDILNRSAGDDRIQAMLPKSNKYQTVTNLSRSAVTSSSRRLPMKNIQESVKQINNFLSLEQTPQGTDTVMYLKQQELLQNSQAHFEEGKRLLLEKNYKDALKSFNQSLKFAPNNKDSKYYRAICYLDSDNPKKCIMDLNELIEQDPTYNQTIYVVLSIAYRRENDLNSSIRALTKGIQKFPKYIEAYQARGQINIYLKKFEKALIDFQNVINLQPYNGFGYIGQADSMKGIGNFKGALQSYNQAISIDARCRNQALLKRAILLYQLKNYDQGIVDFNSLLDENDKNPKAHYYKGKILKKQEQDNEAILHFEQVIKFTTPFLSQIPPEDGKPTVVSDHPKGPDEELAGNALFEIAKIRINQRDFYEAFHNLQRAIHYDFKSKKFIQYKMFVEGVLFLMKRKVKKGVKILTALLEGNVPYESGSPSSPQGGTDDKSKELKKDVSSASPIQDLSLLNQDGPSSLKPYLIHLIHVYRSYGFIITQQYDKALNDLNKASKLKKLDQACIYNRFIAQALIKMEKNDLNGVKNILQQAEIKFPQNKDPYKFQAICIVQGTINDMVDIDNPKKKQAILEAKAILDRALKNSPKDVNLLYLRGLLQFYMHHFYEALIDLDAVIDLDEEPTAKHFVARGRCHACLSMFQEAIADLTRAIELDEEIPDAYFNRGKCAYLLGDTALAFLDFQKLILLEPKNPMVHIYAGNLLMTTGSYDDATKAFTNADSVQKSPLAFYQRSRCNIALANMEQALKDLNVVVERSPQDKIAYVDRECLNALKQAIQGSQGTKNDLISGSPQTKSGFDASPFEKAVITYTKLLNTQYDIENNIHASISAIRQHQQIIPNVKRIKLEKVRALRRKRLKDETYGAPGMKRSKKPKHPFEMQDQADMQLKQQGQQIEPYSYYKENIFGPEDFLLYRGIMHFYLGDYHKAISDFESSIKTKQDLKDSDNAGGESDNVSQGSNQTDLSDVGLCSLNVHESHFNIALCYIQMKDYKSALEKISKLVYEAPKRYTKFLYLIRGLLYQALGNFSKSKGDLDVFNKMQQQDTTQPSLAQDYLIRKIAISVNPYPVGNRLCNYFPEIKLHIPSAPTFLLTRPSFSFPFIKPPNMIPNVEESVLVQDFSLNGTGTAQNVPKPEAPWIKRCDYGIKFTDEIQIVEGAGIGNSVNGGVTETEMSTQQNEEEEEEAARAEHSSEEEQDQQHEHQDVHHYFQHYQNDGQAPEHENERYYLRSYLKEARRKLIRAYSEQIIPKGEYDLFRVTGDEVMLVPDEEDEEENPMNLGEDEKMQFRQQLYGDNDQQKNVIIDDDDDI